MRQNQKRSFTARNYVNCFFSPEVLNVFGPDEQKAKEAFQVDRLNQLVYSLLLNRPNMKGWNYVHSVRYDASLNFYQVVAVMETAVGQYETVNLLLQASFTVNNQPMVFDGRALEIRSTVSDLKANEHELPENLVNYIKQNLQNQSKKFSSTQTQLNFLIDSLNAEIKTAEFYDNDVRARHLNNMDELEALKQKTTKRFDELLNFFQKTLAEDQSYAAQLAKMWEEEKELVNYRAALAFEANRDIKGKELQNQLQAYIEKDPQTFMEVYQNLRRSLDGQMQNFNHQLNGQYQDYLQVQPTLQKIKDKVFVAILTAARDYYKNTQDKIKLNERFGEVVNITSDGVFEVDFSCREATLEILEDKISRLLTVTNEKGKEAHRLLKENLTASLNEWVEISTKGLIQKEFSFKFSSSVKEYQKAAEALARPIRQQTVCLEAKEVGKLLKEKEREVLSSLQGAKEINQLHGKVKKTLEQVVAKKQQLLAIKLLDEKLQNHFNNLTGELKKFAAESAALKEFVCKTFSEFENEHRGSKTPAEIIEQVRYDLRILPHKQADLLKIVSTFQQKIQEIQTNCHQIQQIIEQHFAGNQPLLDSLKQNQEHLKASQKEYERINALANLQVDTQKVQADHLNQKISELEARLEPAEVEVVEINANDRVEPVQAAARIYPKEPVVDKDNLILLVPAKNNEGVQIIPLDILKQISFHLQRILSPEYNDFWANQVYKAGPIGPIGGSNATGHARKVPNGISLMIEKMNQFPKEKLAQFENNERLHYDFVKHCFTISADKFKKIQGYQNEHSNPNSFFATTALFNRALIRTQFVRDFYRYSEELNSMFCEEVSMNHWQAGFAQQKLTELKPMLGTWSKHLEENIPDLQAVPRASMAHGFAFVPSLMGYVTTLFDYINPFITLLDSLL